MEEDIEEAVQHCPTFRGSFRVKGSRSEALFVLLRKRELFLHAILNVSGIEHSVRDEVHRPEAAQVVANPQFPG
jgi:hypothetical protein